jgi:hypothetical protein
MEYETMQTDHLVSVLLKSTQFINAKKFGEYENKTMSMVFNVATGERLTLSNLYSDSEINAEIIQKLVQKQNIRCKIYQPEFEKKFLCNKEGLVFLPSQTNCPERITLSWEDLRGIIDRETFALLR